MDVSLRS